MHANAPTEAPDLPPSAVAQGSSESAEHTHAEHEHHDEGEWKLQAVASAICLAALIPAHWAPNPTVALISYLLAYVAGAWFPFVEVREKLAERSLDVHFLMLAVAVGAAAIGQWAEGATLLFLFSASGALEHYAMDRTQRAIKSLFHAAPKTAVVLAPWGAERRVPVEELTPGMLLLVRPGELFPVDAEIAKGETSADESTVTGEAVPVAKTKGDPVFAGTLNLEGSVNATVRRAAKESALQKIIDLIEHAQRSKAPSQRFTDRFGSGYTLSVLGVTLVMFFVWWLGGHAAFRSTTTEPSAFYHAMTLLVVASPCALVLSIPSAILAAIASGARSGTLFRGGAAVERLAEIRAVAMDKTGTLTTGNLKVERVESFPPGREQEVLEWAASLDRHSTHPLARAIVRHATQQNVEVRELEQVTSTTGCGVSTEVDGMEIRLGKQSWVMADAPQFPNAEAAPDEVGVSQVWISAGDLRGRILLRDEIRKEARGLLESLRRRQIRTILLTGDRASAAAQLAKDLQLDEIRAELRPTDKLELIESLMAKGEKVAMVGDGVNDAPSIAAAHVGVAMGVRGSDAALEQADVVLMNDRLENFVGAWELSRRARAVIKQNLAISLGVIAVLVFLAIFQRIPLTLGVVGHEGSTLIVVLNSLRLLRKTTVC